jgi:hypothetical protein
MDKLDFRYLHKFMILRYGDAYFARIGVTA